MLPSDITSSSTLSLNKFSKLVALPHSVFALPFALAAFFLAIDHYQVPVTVSMFFFTVLAIVAARTASMAFNRLVDRRIDALNPRTMGRELPSGTLSLIAVKSIIVCASAIFFLSAALLGQHCLILAPVVLAILFVYSYSKRFTKYSHFILGLCLALAPGGAWWVVQPEVAFTPLLLMASVVFWVAGFDILYSAQDKDFDLRTSLHSFPAKLGLKKALRWALLLHLAATIGFLLVGISAQLPLFYYGGVLLLSVFLLGQHLLISENNLSRINQAFFTCNGLVSIGYLLLVVFTL